VLIDREQTTVVLQAPEVGGPGSIVLCARHVARVTTPAGWEVRDLRVLDLAEPQVVLVEAPVVLVEPAVVPVVPVVSAVPSVLTAAITVSAVAPDGSLVVDDGATPLLGRAFRAASPGELRRPGEPRGFAWLERRHGQVDGGPDGLRPGIEDHGQ
jgi:hypothetical protein